MKLLHFLFSLLLGLLLLATDAYATDLYVASNCSGQPTPCYTTGQAAANATGPSDTVYFRAGTYAGFTASNSGSAGNYITFRPYQSEVVTIAGSSVACGGGYPTLICIPTSSAYVTIQGFKVDGGVAITQGIEIDAPYARVLYNEVYQTGGTGIACYLYFGGTTTVGWDCHDGVIQGNVIHDTNQANIEQSGGHRRNTGTNWGAGTIANDGAYNMQFLDNVVYFNHGEGLTVVGAGHLVRGNIVADNWSANIYCATCRNTTFDRNFAYVSSDARTYPLVTSTNQNNPAGFSGGDCDPVCAPMHDLTITNNVFNGGLFRYSVGGGFPDTNSKIYGNTMIMDNSIQGVGLEYRNAGTSITNLVIRNNIIYMTQDPAGVGAMRIDPALTSSTISNNIYYRSAGERYDYAGSIYTSLASWASASGDSNSLATNPLLIDASTVPCRLWVDPRGSLGAPCSVATVLASRNGKYCLRSDSPAIDAGISAIATGVSVPSNHASGRPDIGACQTFGVK